jgi:hypothetical protein
MIQEPLTTRGVMAVLLDLSGERVLLCDADGPLLDSDQRVVDLVGEALASHASLIAVPVSRLGADYFQLRSGLAGAIVQKVVNYRIKLAIIGDITDYLVASSALRAWVRESNQHNEVCFLPRLDDLAARLNTGAAPPG